MKLSDQPEEPLDPRQTVALLERAARGEREATAELFERLHADLRARARRLMAAERGDHTLQPTALVNEAWLRLSRERPPAETRLHFLELAGRTMRRVLVDHARRRSAEKRGGGAGVTLATEHLAGGDGGVDVLALEDALERLASHDERAARIVDLRFYSGLTEPEVAQRLGVSERTVRGDWAHARMWLHRALFPDGRRS